mmetsp:Transcript_15923/g.46017  ORF Transcript_15923/g.46017 Transcript_15923/m.46017 type:complete len:421 (+) Transcript_15923:213-1475(+)
MRISSHMPRSIAAVELELVSEATAPDAMSICASAAWPISSCMDRSSLPTEVRFFKFAVNARCALETNRRSSSMLAGEGGGFSISSSLSSSFSLAATSVIAAGLALAACASSAARGIAHNGAYSSRGVPWASVFNHTAPCPASMWHPPGLPRGQFAADSNFAPKDLAASLQTFSSMMRMPPGQSCVPYAPKTTFTCLPPPQAQHASLPVTPSGFAQSAKAPLSFQPAPYVPSGLHHCKSSYCWQEWLLLLRQPAKFMQTFPVGAEETMGTVGATTAFSACFDFCSSSWSSPSLAFTTEAQTGAYSSSAVPMGSKFIHTVFFSVSMWQPPGWPTGQCAAKANLAPKFAAAWAHKRSFTISSPSLHRCEPKLPNQGFRVLPPPQMQHASNADTPSVSAQSSMSESKVHPSPLFPSAVHHFCAL